jgi:hypothetical protein
VAPCRLAFRAIAQKYHCSVLSEHGFTCILYFMITQISRRDQEVELGLFMHRMLPGPSHPGLGCRAPWLPFLCFRDVHPTSTAKRRHRDFPISHRGPVRLASNASQTSGNDHTNTNNLFPFPTNPRPSPHQIFHLSRGASQSDIKARCKPIPLL